ncbi:MAG: hypothetical protein KZQ96_21255 [Candidatus Thiodiazotropha sp. (ex Lucinoma borealis)]|nr:hypothetical protein [Candidatus Thiodiazotropha sp. (ex Lucinoma borealis)]
MGNKYLSSDLSKHLVANAYLRNRLGGSRLSKNVRSSVYDKVGTLCDDPVGLTCSIYTLRRYGKAKEIVNFASFIALKKALLCGEITGGWVPGAFPGNAGFLLSGEFEIADLPIMQIPDIVLAGTTTVPPDPADVVYRHPATADIFHKIDTEYACVSDELSNSMAAKKLIDHGENAIAVTNSLCSDHYGLFVYQILTVGALMPFYLYSRN